MSHLVSEDLGAGFARGIKATASFIGNMESQCPWWEMGVCNGIFWVIKISNDFALRQLSLEAGMALERVMDAVVTL